MLKMEWIQRRSLVCLSSRNVLTASDSRNPLERVEQRWHSPVYGFFKEEVIIDYKKDRQSHLFQCARKGCEVQVRRYLDTKDAASCRNLFKHAHQCWKDEAVDHVIELGSAELVRKKLVKPKTQSKSITEFFDLKNPKKAVYSHRPLTKLQTRYVSFSK